MIRADRALSLKEIMLNKKRYIRLERKANKEKAKIINFLISDIIKKSNAILDFGCGDGIIKNYLEKWNNKNIFATDKEPNIIRHNKNYVVSDLTFTPFKDESFDLLIMNGVYFYIKEHKKLIREYFRIMKKALLPKP